MNGFDKTTVDTLIGNLESAEVNLSNASAQNAQAQAAASGAAADLAAAQASNRAAVAAVKDYFASLDDTGAAPAGGAPGNSSGSSGAPAQAGSSSGSSPSTGDGTAVPAAGDAASQP